MYQVRAAAAVVSLLRDPAGRQPDTAWDGHPAASYAWARAAATVAPRHQWMVIRNRTGPCALLTTRSRFRTPVLYPVGYHHGGFQPLHGGNIGATAEALARISPRYAAYLPFCSRELADAVASRAGVYTREHDVAPFVEPISPDEYLASRPRKLRATIRHAEREFAELNGVIELVRRSAVESVLPHLAAVEAKGHRRSGHILSGRRANFLRTALLEFLADDTLELWVARRAQSYVGYLVAIHGPRSTYLWTMAITAEMAPLSLGSAIFHRAIAYNLAQDRRVSLGTGGTLFKRRFATGAQQLYDLLLVPARALGARRIIGALPETRHGGRWR